MEGVELVTTGTLQNVMYPEAIPRPSQVFNVARWPEANVSSGINEMPAVLL